jgi:hypothetical protein
LSVKSVVLQNATLNKKKFVANCDATAPGVNFTNLMAQSANMPVGILWRHSVSPTKLRPSLSVHSTRISSQPFMLYVLGHAQVK